MKHSLLIIDDNNSILKLLKAVFEKKYTVYTASDGVEAMFLLSLGIKPDLIISDLDMQNISGYELIKHLSTSNIYNKIPVVILSGPSDTDSKTLQQHETVIEICKKPFDPVHLSNIVRDTLHFKNQQQGKYNLLKTLN